jgi:hypothetical protein
MDKLAAKIKYAPTESCPAAIFRNGECAGGGEQF